MFLSGLDLNVEVQNRSFLRISAKGSYASGQTRFLAGHDVFATDYLSTMYEWKRSNRLAAENRAEANTRIYSLKFNDLECLLKR